MLVVPPRSRQPVDNDGRRSPGTPASPRLGYRLPATGYRSQASQGRRRGRVQQLDTVSGDGDDHLQPHAEASGEVDPRLDAEAHPLLQRLPIAGDEIRRLVDLQAD